jgi:imidazolonepropionase-like amidohydrolase
MGMQSSLDLIIECQDALLSSPAQPHKLQRRAFHIGIRGGKIIQIAERIDHPSTPRWSAGKATVLPGLIDSQVHFRDPGNPEKENFASGTMGAILGKESRENNSPVGLLRPSCVDTR